MANDSYYQFGDDDKNYTYSHDHHMKTGYAENAAPYILIRK